MDRHGNAYGILGVYDDITQRKEAEERLRKSERRLRESQRVARLGSWDLDLVSGKLEWSDETYILFDKTPEESVPSFDAFAGMVHPDDREMMQTNFDNALQSENTPYHVAVRIINDSGREWVMEAFGAVRRDEGGRPIGIFGTAHDITERKRSEEALLVGEERLRQSVRVSNLGIFDHDHLAETIYWSARQKEIYGWGPDEKVTLPAFIDCIYPEDREKIAADVRRAHDPAGDGLYDVEHRIIRRDGAVRWVVTRSRTFFSGEGGARRPVRTIGAVSDITERKNAEERIGQSLREKETLLRELYHRTKNNMQVITSLLNLQSQSVDDNKTLQIIKDTQNRIFSMALVHEKLYKAKDLTKVNLKDYIADLAASLMDSYQIGKRKISLLMDIDNIHVSIDTITPCGLVINELMTNALKYAFPDNRGGKITISAHRAEGGIGLRFSDDGVGLPRGMDLRNPESLGLKIVNTLVETQLKGSIVIDCAHGTTVAIRFKEIDKRNRI